MQNRDTFSSLHPIISFLFFGLVLVFSMFVTHPACILISLLSALFYSIYLRGKKAVRLSLFGLLPLILLTALINPAFNHEGETILRYLPTGNPLTLESIVWGVAAGAVLAAVVCWFSCYNVVMTSDKFIYLFGRLIPAMSLVLSMSLRFIPKFSAQIKVVSNAQRCVGRDVSNGSVWQRMRHAFTILSIMLTWSFENAIETSDSMRSRGYGLPGRTAFSIYRFDRRDCAALLFLCACGAWLITGWARGGLHWRYFPSVRGVGAQVYPVSLFIVYALLSLLPLIVDIAADKKWAAVRAAAGGMKADA